MGIYVSSNAYLGGIVGLDSIKTICRISRHYIFQISYRNINPPLIINTALEAPSVRMIMPCQNEIWELSLPVFPLTATRYPSVHNPKSIGTNKRAPAPPFLSYNPRAPFALGSAQTDTSKKYYKNYIKRPTSSGHNKNVVS